MKYILEKCEYLRFLIGDHRNYRRIFSLKYIKDMKLHHPECFKVLSKYESDRFLEDSDNFYDIIDF